MSVRSVLLVLVLAPRALFGAVNEWSPVGPAGADVRAVAVSPSDAAAIVAGTAGGYSVTRNGGASWTPYSTGWATEAIHFDPSNPSIVVAATGAAIARSTDGGTTFVPVLLEAASCLADDPSNPAVLFAGTMDHVVKSVDRGLTWAFVYTGPGHSFVNAVAVDPSRSQTVWAAMTFGGVRRSLDGGATWAAVSGGVPMSVSAIAIHPSDSSVVLLLAMDGVYRSTNGGSAWSKVTSLQGGEGALVADRSAPGTFWAGGSDGIAFSSDGGASWNRMNAGLTTLEVQALAIDPADHARVYAGTNGGGVFVLTAGSGGAPTLRLTSPNGGEMWQAGSVRPITWVSTGPIASVKLEYSTTAPWGDQLVDPVTIAASAPNTGSYAWTVPQAMSPVCHVRVSDAAGTVSDISDAAFQITSCGFFGLTPPFSASFPAAGGAGRIDVHATTGCGWTAVSESAWIAVTSGAIGSGDGAVAYSVAANPGAAAREGTLRIGGKEFAVEQAGGAGSGEAVVFVPVVLDVHGGGSSHYTSELTLTNRSDSDALVRVTYTGAPTLGGGGGSATFTLGARRQVVHDDAIAWLASLGVAMPSSGNRAGTLRVSFSGAFSASAVAATARTTTAVANGQAGLAYAGVPSARLLTEASYVCGLRENATDRSNVALQNAGRPEDGPVTLRLTVTSGDTGAKAVLPDVTLSPGEFRQASGILGANGMANGWVAIEKVEGGAPYYAYGVVNDQVNSDGSFLPPHVTPVSAPAGLTIPVVLEASVYSSELVVTNVSDAAKSVWLTFVSDQVNPPDGLATTTLTLAPRAQVVIPNVFQYFRDRGVPGIGPPGSGYVGALFLRPFVGDLGGVVAGVRTSSPGGGGRYGLFYPATPAGAASEATAWLYGLRQDGSNRTNLALVNTGEAGEVDDVFEVDVWDGETGALVHTEGGLSLRAMRWMQVNTLLAAWAPGVAQGWARVRRVAGTNPFVAYAVINDGGAPRERSDDGAFLAAAED